MLDVTCLCAQARADSNDAVWPVKHAVQARLVRVVSTIRPGWHGATHSNTLHVQSSICVDLAKHFLVASLTCYCNSHECFLTLRT